MVDVLLFPQLPDDKLYQTRIIHLHERAVLAQNTIPSRTLSLLLQSTVAGRQSWDWKGPTSALLGEANACVIPEERVSEHQLPRYTVLFLVNASIGTAASIYVKPLGSDHG